MEWKWSIGEQYQKSARKIKTIDDVKNIEMKQEIKAYDLSLNQDEYNWDSINDVQHFSPEQFKVTNKREQLDEKISNRQLVQHCGYNPYMNTDNYVNDITIRDQFLVPQNTNSVSTSKT